MNVTGLVRRTVGGALVSASLLALPLAGFATVQAHQVAHRSNGTPTWLTYNAKTHTANVTIIAGFSSDAGGFNFNGHSKGKMVVSVPAGTKVSVTFSNAGALPHSVAFTSYASRTAVSGFKPAFPGSASPNDAVGIAKGPKQKFTFVAKTAGTFAIVCAVPGHVSAGMWDTFKVTKGGKASVTITK
jgi:sulfocyanin